MARKFEIGDKVKVKRGAHRYFLYKGKIGKITRTTYRKVGTKKQLAAVMYGVQFSSNIADWFEAGDLVKA